jgi:hypothetical protein
MNPSASPSSHGSPSSPTANASPQTSVPAQGNVAPYRAALTATCGDLVLARDVTADLEQAGVPAERLRLAAQNLQGLSAQRGVAVYGNPSSIGATTGALIGGFAGAAAGASLLLFPEYGWMAQGAAIAGAILGTIVGVVVGVLVSRERRPAPRPSQPSHVSGKYHRQLDQGKVVVIAAGSPEEASRWEHALDRSACEQHDVETAPSPAFAELARLPSIPAGRA